MDQSLIEIEIAKIVKDYKIEPDKAKELFLELLQKSGLQDYSEANIQRTRKYKDFIKSVRKELYYRLRQFKSDDGIFANLLNQAQNSPSHDVFTQIVNAHISTKERQSDIASFLDQIKDELSPVHNVIDLGGGVFPLQLSYDFVPDLENYVFIEKDKKSAEVVEAFAKTKNVKIYVHAEEMRTDTSKYFPPKVTEFDLAIMLKFIPLISRQDRHLLDAVAKLPAKKLLITASKESLTKHIDIESREDGILREFIKLTNRKILKRIDISNEFGYILE